MNTASTFLSRLPGTTANEEREIITTAFGIVDETRKRAAEIRSNQHLSKIGQDEQIKALAKGGLAAQFQQLKSRNTTATAHLANLRKALALKALDRNDLFAEMQRQEIRTILRGLPDADRTRMALETPEFSEAVVHALPAMSGLTAELHRRVRDAAIERVHGPQIRSIEQREHGNEVVNSALKVAEMYFRDAAGLKDEDKL